MRETRTTEPVTATVTGSGTGVLDDPIESASDAAATPPRRRSSLVPGSVQKYFRSGPGVAGAIILGALVVVAIAAPVIAPYDPLVQSSQVLQGPSSDHWLGTDEVGRDILSRLIYGTGSVLVTAFAVSAVAMAVGVPLGLISGYFRGRVDHVIMRFLDVLMAMPGIILALIVAAFLGQGLGIMIIAIAVGSLPTFALLARSSTLKEREAEYVQAARSMGAGHMYLMGRCILPNITAPLIVQTTVTSSMAVATAAALSFLGVALPPPQPTWGGMLSAAQSNLFTAPWYGVYPGVALVVAIAGFDLVGRGMQAAIGGSRGKRRVRAMGGSFV